jgi:hypothetical protein
MASAIGRRALLEGSGAAAGLIGIGTVPRLAQATSQPQLPTSGELQAAVQAKQAINHAFLPTGSDAHKTWVEQIANELTAAGVQNVATPPFSFTQWTVTRTSLLLQEGTTAGPVKITSYFPYSAPTTEDGVTAPLTYLGGVSGFFGPPASGQQATLVNPSFLGQPLNLSVNGQTLEAALNALDVTGKIVVFDLPTPPVPLTTALADAFYVNDPDHSLPNELGLAGLTGLFFVSVFASALLAAGAVGAVSIVPFKGFWAKNYYFRGTIVGPPVLIVDAQNGEMVKTTISEFGANGPVGTLTLTADVNPGATFPSIIGTIPGKSDKLIILNSHTDSINIIEEIGPIVIVQLAKYFAALPVEQRPYTIQIFIEGSHLVGNLDQNAYIQQNMTNLQANALVDITIEHIGGLEVVQGLDGLVPHPDGLGESNWLSVGPIPGNTSEYSDPVVRATIALAQKFKRTFVGPTSIIGLGISSSWRSVVTTTASIDQPSWLLNFDMPHQIEPNQLLDYDTLRTWVQGYVEMIETYMNTPASNFTTPYAA